MKQKSPSAIDPNTIVDQLYDIALDPHSLDTFINARSEAGLDSSAALGDTLEEIFKVTPAEQGVIRALVEGMNTKEISLERGTSEGTVRGQIKTILAKMNARSPSEVIRLVMSLGDISQTTQSPSTTARPLESLHPGDWLQSEVWKPFKSLVLPDGRKMDYHDMGPEQGMAILYSHMRFCMARWHKPMCRKLW